VALAPITDPELVAPAIVDALHLEIGRAPTRERLIQHFRDRKALLVMDNFEQVLAAATLVADLIRACPDLKVIASSRGPLRISGEQEMPVPPLTLPDPGAPAERVSQYEAVKLFIDRAVAVKPGFEVTNDNAPAVAEICARLDGLPLAIELAAARIKLLPPAAILTRLQSRLGLLQSTARDLPDRQKTLRGAIAWSHDLLDEPGRRLFARLAVFAGGGALEDIEVICGGPDLGIDVLAGLEALVDQSLVRQEQHGDEARAVMLETIREYAIERLVASPDAEAVKNRHALRFLAIAEAAVPHLLGIGRREWLARLDREHDNLRAAFDFCVSSGRIVEAMRLSAALWRFWHFRGHLREGFQRIKRVLADPTSPAHPTERETALEAAGGLAYWLGEFPSTRAFYEESLALARANADPGRISNALYNLSFLPMWAEIEGDPNTRAVEANGQVEEALALARQMGDRATIARCLWAKANIIFYLRNDVAVSLAILAEAIPIFRDVGDHFGLSWALHSEGLGRLRAGELAAARTAFDEELTLLGEAHDTSGVAIALGDQSQLALAEGDRLRGFRLAGASQALRRLTGAEIVAKVDAVEGRTLEPTPADQGAWQEGLAMTFDQALTHALRRS
jgi:predicted ATPase